MEVNLPYIFRVALALTVFYIVYFTLFREEKNFLFKRIYFIAAGLMSITIPMLSFQVEVVAQNESLTIVPLYSYIQSYAIQSSAFEVQIANDSVQQAESVLQTIWRHISQIGWLEIIWALFTIGAAVLLLRMVGGHSKIRRVVKNASLHTLYGSSVWVTTEKLPPFTYFRKVIIPVNILDSPYLEAVISHERIHARGWHCLDLYLADILCLLQWFNPFAWLLKRAVRDNIEFLTDNLVTQQMNRDEYQMGMVSLAGKDMIHALPAASNISQLKRRIEMMNKVKSIRYRWARVVLLIPVLALVTVTLSGREVCIVEVAGMVIESETSAENRISNQNPIGGIIDNNIEAYQDLIGKIANITVPFQDNIKAEQINEPYLVINGKLYAPGTFDMATIKDSIKQIAVLRGKSALTLYGVEAVDIMITEKNGEQEEIKLKTPDIRSFDAAFADKDWDKVVEIMSASNIHLFIDGKLYAPGTFDLTNIDKNDIKTVTILTDDTSLTIYGVGNVIILETGKKSTVSDRTQVVKAATTLNRVDFILKMPGYSDTYFVYDGKIYAPGTLDLNAIQNSIKYIEILDDETAKAKYGVAAPVYILNKGRNLTEPIYLKIKDMKLQDDKILLEAAVAKNIDKVLEIADLFNIHLVVDGKFYAPGTIDLTTINRNNVESINVLRDKSAIAIYGVDTVILIDTGKKASASDRNLIGKTAKKGRPDMVFTMSDTSNVYHVFDGKIYAPGTLDLNAIQNSIKYIEILDNETAKAKYGVAPVYFIKKGKNPTRPIYLKINTPLVSTQNRVDTTSGYSAQLQDRINNKESINRVIVTKDTTQYSDKNVILVESRDNPDEPVELALSDGGMPAFVSGSRVVLTVPDRVLYMVDGKKIASLNNFEADIVSFAILKKEKAIELYGESGEDGIIAVKTK